MARNDPRRDPKILLPEVKKARFKAGCPSGGRKEQVGFVIEVEF